MWGCPGMSLTMAPVLENIGFSCDWVGSPKETPGDTGLQSICEWDLEPPLMLDLQWVCECE